jgi:hypothetical protein
MRRFLAFAVFAVVAGCGSSPGPRPDGTLTGTMTTGSLPVVMIDGKEMRMAPGARVMTAGNTSITPNQVPPGSRVRYKLDAAGQVSQVWLLPAER